MSLRSWRDQGDHHIDTAVGLPRRSASLHLPLSLPLPFGAVHGTHCERRGGSRGGSQRPRTVAMKTMVQRSLEPAYEAPGKPQRFSRNAGLKPSARSERPFMKVCTTHHDKKLVGVFSQRILVFSGRATVCCSQTTRLACGREIGLEGDCLGER